MKRILCSLTLLFFIVGSAMAQAPDVPANKGDHFGKKFDAKDAISPDVLPDFLKGKDSAEVKLVGTVVEVCKSRGCFIYLKTEKGKIYITTGDAFFVPMVMNGKTVIVEGMASMDKESKKIAVRANGILVMEGVMSLELRVMS